MGEVIVVAFIFIIVVVSSMPRESALRRGEKYFHGCHTEGCYEGGAGTSLQKQDKGEGLTFQLIEGLLLQLSTATDSLGVPLFGEQMVTIWKQEKKLVNCIQDLSRVALYTITGHIKKGGVELPVFQYARDTTFLESFHLHQSRCLD